MNFSIDEKQLVEKYKLIAPCLIVHDWNQDNKGMEICQVIKYLSSLSNYVDGLYNVCNNNDRYGGLHYILLRDENTPYNYF